MIIRQYKNEDCVAVSELFYETVHSVNAKDYSAEQLTAWVSDAEQLISRRNDFLNQHTLIAEIDGVVAGFGSIDKSGCLDMLFVHKDYQRKGVGTALCDELEKGFAVIRTYASITAKPFFERRGYAVTEAREVVRGGVKLRNYEMKK